MLVWVQAGVLVHDGAAVLSLKPDYANRTSYVIAPSGTIVYQYTSLNPYKHVTNTLSALKTWTTAATTKR